MSEENKEKEEKEYTLKYKESELASELQSLENDEDIQLFLKVQTGAEKYARYIKFLDLFEKNKK